MIPVTEAVGLDRERHDRLVEPARPDKGLDEARQIASFLLASLKLIGELPAVRAKVGRLFQDLAIGQVLEMERPFLRLLIARIGDGEASLAEDRGLDQRAGIDADYGRGMEQSVIEIGLGALDHRHAAGARMHRDILVAGDVELIEWGLMHRMRPHQDVGLAQRRLLGASDLGEPLGDEFYLVARDEDGGATIEDHWLRRIEAERSAEGFIIAGRVYARTIRHRAGRR